MLPALLSAQELVTPEAFESRATPHFLIHYPQEVRARAETAARIAEETYRDFAPRLELEEWKERSSIFIFADSSFLRENDIYGQEDTFIDAGGDVDLFKHRVVIAADQEDRQFRRNVSKLVLRSLIYRRLMGTGGGLMRLIKSLVYAEWLIFGASEYYTCPVDPLREGLFRAQSAKGLLFKPTEIFNYDYLPAAKGRAALAQSAVMIEWLEQTWGEEAVWDLIRSYPDYWSNDALLQDILGVSQQAFLMRFAEETAELAAGPDLPAGAVKVADGNGRFPGDFLFPVMHRNSGRVFFTGEYDGAWNVFYPDAQGRIKRVFREVPFKTIEAPVSALRLERDVGRIDVVRFKKIVTAEMEFDIEGDVKALSFVPLERKGPQPDAAATALREWLAYDGPIYGQVYHHLENRIYFSAALDHIPRLRLYSVNAQGQDLRLEIDSPWGVLYPAMGGGKVYFCTPGGYAFDIYSLPLEDLRYERVRRIRGPVVPKPEPEAVVLEPAEDVNPLTPDVVIPWLLWNGSDEFGLNEFWVSLMVSTGLVSTSGFEDDTSGVFLAPLLLAEYVRKFEIADFSIAGRFQAGDVLEVQDYETRNKLTLDVLFRRSFNSRLLAGVGLRGDFMERRELSADDYENAQDVGTVAFARFGGVILREHIPRRGFGCLLGVGRYLEDLGSTDTYTRVEFDADAFLPISNDTVLQVYGGLFAAIGSGAPEFDMGRKRGVLSQPFRQHSGRYMAVGRLAYRFPVVRDLNYTLSGVILMRQIRMGVFADLGIVSNESFEEWEEGAPFLTSRKSVGIFFMLDAYPAEGFQMPITLTWALDPDNDTNQIKLEFGVQF